LTKTPKCQLADYINAGYRSVGFDVVVATLPRRGYNTAEDKALAAGQAFTLQQLEDFLVL